MNSQFIASLQVKFLRNSQVSRPANKKYNYKVDGVLNGLVPINVSDNFAFFNPKAGMTYKLKDNTIYIFLCKVTQRAKQNRL